MRVTHQRRQARPREKKKLLDSTVGRSLSETGERCKQGERGKRTSQETGLVREIRGRGGKKERRGRGEKKKIDTCE